MSLTAGTTIISHRELECKQMVAILENLKNMHTCVHLKEAHYSIQIGQTVSEKKTSNLDYTFVFSNGGHIGQTMYK